jgi:hypothetical protein
VVASVGEWIKRRGPERWHLVDDSPDRGVACVAADVGADSVTWTDPDRYPPDVEWCTSCAAIFSGAANAPIQPTAGVAPLADGVE